MIENHVSLAEKPLVDAISTLRFDTTTCTTAAHYGVVFNRCSGAVFDTLITNRAQCRDYIEVIRIKRVSELAGYDSPIIATYLKEALSEMEMLGFLPWSMNREQGFFSVTHRYLIHAYRYARELDHETDKWDPLKARQQFQTCLYTNEKKAFLGCNPTDNTIFRPYFRFYDENMETLDVFLKFDELLGDRSSMDDVLAIWTTVNEMHWAGDHYFYKPGAPIYECETGFFILSAYLHNITGFALPHFKRCAVDLWSRLLKSQWDSPNWRDYVSRHADSNEQKRLNNTLISFSVMHAYYPLFSEESRIAFRKLLCGDRVDHQPAAWDGLVNHSNLYADGRFCRNDTYGSTEPSDEATAMGAMLLLLQGVVPGSGSLAIPLIEEMYEDPIGGLISSHFGMDISAHLLRIPVWKGSMGFQFGTEIALVDFDCDGIYELGFSQDWNRVTDIECMGEIASYRYVQRDVF